MTRGRSLTQFAACRYSVRSTTVEHQYGEFGPVHVQFLCVPCPGTVPGRVSVVISVAGIIINKLTSNTHTVKNRDVSRFLGGLARRT